MIQSPFLLQVKAHNLIVVDAIMMDKAKHLVVKTRTMGVVREARDCLLGSERAAGLPLAFHFDNGEELEGGGGGTQLARFGGGRASGVLCLSVMQY